jgi:hypothetical protein
VPVARSDPRRATIIGIGGIIVGVAMIAIVLLANNAGNGSSTTHSSRTRFDVGPAESLANSIKQQGPIFFNDTANGSRPIALQHFGDDPKTGWVAFDAAIGGCVLTWHPDTHDFTDCNSARVPADGGDRHHYPVTVDQNGELFVDLSLDATTTPSSGSSTSS